MIKLLPKIKRRWLLWIGLMALVLIGSMVIFVQPRPKAESPLPEAVTKSKSQPKSKKPAPAPTKPADTEATKNNPNPDPDAPADKDDTTDTTSNQQVVAPTEFGSIGTLGEYMQKVMVYALPTGVGLAVIMTIYAGILLMLSQGQPDKIKDSQEIIQGAVLGLIVLVLTRLLATYLYIPSAQETVVPPAKTTNQATSAEQPPKDNKK